MLLLGCFSFFSYSFQAFAYVDNFDYGDNKIGKEPEPFPMYNDFSVERPKNWPFHDEKTNEEYEENVKKYYYEGYHALIDRLLAKRRFEGKFTYQEIKFTEETYAFVKKRLRENGYTFQEFIDYYYSFDQLVLRAPNKFEHERGSIIKEKQKLPSEYQNQNTYSIQEHCYNMDSNVTGEILVIPESSDVCIKTNRLVNLSSLDVTVIGQSKVEQLQTFYETAINGTVVLRNHSPVKKLYLYPLFTELVIFNITLDNAQTLDELKDITFEDKKNPKEHMIHPVLDTTLAKLNEMTLLSFDKHYKLEHVQLKFPQLIKRRKFKQERTAIEHNTDLMFSLRSLYYKNIE